MAEQQNAERIPLGSSDVSISPLGIGAWAWGDRKLWGYGTDYGQPDVEAAFKTCLEIGINFFDTAEIYGFGRSERLLGQFVRASGQPVVITSKFYPYPWRLGKGALRRALHGSLRRLGIDQVDLYLIHLPYPPVPVETWMSALAYAVDAGLIRTAGVSNYRVEWTRRAHAALAKRGVPLACNQIPFSLLNRRHERNGQLDLCRDLGVTVVAYSPLGMGVLTGKYTPDNPPPGARGRRYGRERLAQIQPLIDLLREIGQARGDKTPSQVALNWVIRKGAVPIPGAKNARQAAENAGALGWSLTADEVSALDTMSEGLQ